MDDETDDFYENDRESHYKDVSLIDFSELYSALSNLHLLGDDPFLRMQAFHLGIVDGFITNLDYSLLRTRFHEERTPTADAAFLSAQSQMWIFAAYELLRTWRERAENIVKWAQNNGLEQKLATFEKDEGYEHYGRQIRADQIKAVLADPEIMSKLAKDLKRTSLVFISLEAIRVSLAKHEVWKNAKSGARTPGSGRVNSYCGALDYELENGRAMIGYISRRDIADEIRELSDPDMAPTDEALATFTNFMRGLD